MDTAESKNITACKASPTNPDHIYISTLYGNLHKWDWVTGKRLETWKPKAHTGILDIDVCDTDWGVARQDTVFVLVKTSDGGCEILAAIKQSDGTQNKWEAKTILRTATYLDDLKVVAAGAVVVATARGKLLLGQTAQKPIETIQAGSYTWRETTLPVRSTCFDVRLRPSAPSKSKTSQSDVVDLVLGEEEGSILIYNDIVNALLQCEDGNKIGTNKISNRLHWHRNAVLTVKWSRDGKHYISTPLSRI